MDIKNLINDTLLKQINQSIDSSGGIKTIFGEAIALGDKSIIPVAKVEILLSSGSSADADGDIDQTAKGKSTGLSQALGGVAKANASANINIKIEPVGFIIDENDNLNFKKV